MIFLIIWLFAVGCSATYDQVVLSKRESSHVHPNENVMFTVLTSQMIRLAYSPNGLFEDRASFAIQKKDLGFTDFESYTDDDQWLHIQTAHLHLKYDTKSQESFNDANIQIEFKLNDEWKIWMPSMDPTDGNLLGTVRTLDGDSGNTELRCVHQSNAGQHCSYGLISRNGFAIVDDTINVRLEDETSKLKFPWVIKQNYPRVPKDSCGIFLRTRHDCGYVGISEDACVKRGCCYNNKVFGPHCFHPTRSKYQPPRDWYFFGHGHDYKQALYDFTLISGKVPLPPKYVFGVWSSRYWAYNDAEFLGLVDRYENNRIPLDVMIVDMDWHKTFYKTGGGWTGWTWDKRLFADPKGFLKELRSKNIKNSVNLHPADGIRRYEKQFERMRELLGYGSDADVIPFQSTNMTFMQPFLSEVIRGLEEDGVDFFWLDWQQGESWSRWTGVEGLNPTLWLNYVFWKHFETTRNERPLNFHRWGGLGNHRYPIGFSGDTNPGWETLSYQVWFTSTASNVLFSYWSHDIGGHTAPSEAELYTRWVQFGIFSPIFRTHSTKQSANFRYFWKYPKENADIMVKCAQLREQMLPYIYTMARKTYDTAIGLIRPLYYEYPEMEEAYSNQQEYYFGDSMVLRPITSPASEFGLTEQKMWVPPGKWIEWFAGKILEGPSEYTGHYSLADIPVLVKFGSIIPMQELDGYLGKASNQAKIIRFVLFPVDQLDKGYNFTMYDDNGNEKVYDSADNFMKTFIQQTRPSDNECLVEIKFETGKFYIPKGFEYKLEFPNSFPIERVWINGHSVDDFSYSPQTTTATLQLGYVNVRDFTGVSVKVRFMRGNHFELSGIRQKFDRLMRAKEELDGLFDFSLHRVYQEGFPNVLEGIQIIQQIQYNSSAASLLLPQFKTTFEEAVEDVKKINHSKVTPLLTNL